MVFSSFHSRPFFPYGSSVPFFPSKRLNNPSTEGRSASPPTARFPSDGRLQASLYFASAYVLTFSQYPMFPSFSP